MDIDITPTNSPYMEYSPDSDSASNPSTPGGVPGDQDVLSTNPKTQRQPRQRYLYNSLYTLYPNTKVFKVGFKKI